MKKITARLLPMIYALVIFAGSVTMALGDPPDWAACNKNNPNYPDCLEEAPPSVPEPTAISLIAMGAGAATGYCLRRKKRQ